MKKILACSLAASLLFSLAGCGMAEKTPVTEETLPLPLWAQDEEIRLTEAPAETEIPALTEASETEATISERPELPPVTAPELLETEPAEVETETTVPPETTEPLIDASAFQMEEKFEAVEPEKVYAKKSVNIRSQGNVDSDNMGRLGQGKCVIRIGISDDGWSAVVIEDELRYISSEYLTTEEQTEPEENPNVPEEVEVDDQVYTVDDVNMREGPGFDRAILCRVPEYVELHRTGIVSSGWCRVTYKDQEGFISSGYLAEEHPGESDELLEEEKTDDTVYATREVNFRSGPGTKKAIIGRIPEGTELKRVSIAANGWGKVVYKDQTGYVSGDFLSVEPPSEG